MASLLYSLGGISFQIQHEKVEISKRFLDKISYFSGTLLRHVARNNKNPSEGLICILNFFIFVESPTQIP